VIWLVGLGACRNV
jgi:hypothetical protein